MANAIKAGSKVRTLSGKVLTVTKIEAGCYNLPWGTVAMTLAHVAEEHAFYDITKLTLVSTRTRKAR